MAVGDIPQGQRFSLVYLRRDDQLEDSARMRRRLGATIEDFDRGHFNQYLQKSLGLEYKYLRGMKAWTEYFLELDLRDVLDSVTIFFRFLIEWQTKGDQYDRRHARETLPLWLPEVRRIFAEEGVRYSVDDRGGVHLRVDEQFEVTRAATVRGMGDPRYAAALASLEAGYQALDGAPPDGREAIRDVFGAAENVFKQTFGAQRLAGHLIDQYLRPAVAALPWNQEALEAGDVMCDALKNWATAAHKYRHEIGRPDPHQPPLDVAVLMVSQGTAFVRWLVVVDQGVLAVAKPAPAVPSP
jgi:hypothetical protein